MSDVAGNYQWVVAIEGYKYLLTDGSTAAALTAWAGTDWSLCLPGLTVDIDTKQEINPWDPFVGAGRGRLLVHPADDTASGDEFGRATHRSSAGAKSYLTTDLTQTGTTVVVESTVAFPAAPEELHVGTECIGYAAVTDAHTFGTLTRGKYCPFGIESTGRFARRHRVANADYGVPLNPVVSQYPRVWKGRQVGVWLHAKSGGVLATRANAQCVWAGRIVDIADDPQTGCTVVDMDHILDVVARTTLLRDQFAGRVVEGVQLVAGDRFTLTESISGIADNTADPLVVVASGATPPYEIDAGSYTVDTVCDAVNAWQAQALDDASIDGRYSWAPKDTDAGWRVKCQWQLDDTGGTPSVWWEIGVPRVVSRLLGLTGGHLGTAGIYYAPKAFGTRGVEYDDSEDITPAYSGQSEPISLLVEHIGDPAFPITLSETKGTFTEQAARLPPGFQSIVQTDPALDWGVFLLDGTVVVAAYDDATKVLSHVSPMPIAVTPLGVITRSLPDVVRPYGSDAPPLEVRQVLMVAGQFAGVMKDLLYSTGSPAYNEADHDVFAYGTGIGLPWAMLGDDFDVGLGALPGASNDVMLVIDKPIKFEDLFKADLVMRRTHLIFRDGGLRFVCWSTPTEERAVYALTEDNKFEPAGQDHPRVATVLSSDWAKPATKIEFNRSLRDDTYRDDLLVEDRTAIDDNAGQGEPWTIQARNTYLEFAESGTDAMTLAPELVSWHAYFSRPIRKLTRSIGIFQFFNIAVGDIVTVSDDFARDPTTGERGTSLRPALVVGHRWTAGGAAAGNPSSVSPMGGEVTVAFIDLAGQVRPYSPAAEVDETENGGTYVSGYDNANRTLRVHTSEHTNAAIVGLTPDASYFVAGDKVRVVEVDPDDPTAPLTWLRTIEAVTLTTIKLTVALSSPAWDGAKLYRVIPDLYGDVVTTQRTKSFGADDATGIVDGIGAPFDYGEHPDVVAADAEASTELPERHSVYGYGDGAPRDTGYERGLLRSSQNLIDHKTAIQLPLMFFGVREAVGSTLLIACWPVFLQGKNWGAGMRRLLKVAPQFYSSLGADVTLTLTLSTHPPVRNGLRPPASARSNSVEWSTNSTTPDIPTAKYLDLETIRDSGAGWLYIYGTDECTTTGLAECVMIERGVRV